MQFFTKNKLERIQARQEKSTFHKEVKIHEIPCKIQNEIASKIFKKNRYNCTYFKYI